MLYLSKCMQWDINILRFFLLSTLSFHIKSTIIKGQYIMVAIVSSLFYRSEPARSTIRSLPIVTMLSPVASYSACSTIIVNTAWLRLLSCEIKLTSNPLPKEVSHECMYFIHLGACCCPQMSTFSQQLHYLFCATDNMLRETFNIHSSCSIFTYSQVLSARILQIILRKLCSCFFWEM